MGGNRIDNEYFGPDCSKVSSISLNKSTNLRVSFSHLKKHIHQKKISSLFFQQSIRIIESFVNTRFRSSF